MALATIKSAADVTFEKQIDSYLASIKDTLLTDLGRDSALDYIQWCHKKLFDTIKESKSQDLLNQIRRCADQQEREKLRIVRKKYLPKKYPARIEIGDIVHINFGFGYCGELSDDHYGVVLSSIKANLFLIVPLSSTPLKINPFFLEGLGLPCKNGDKNSKKSYVMFNQIRYIHYRRIESVIGGDTFSVGDKLPSLIKEIQNFFDFPIDKT